MPRPGSESVTVPEGLLARVARLIEDRPDLGFSTKAEAVRQAIREWLEKNEGAEPRIAAGGAQEPPLVVRKARLRR